MLPLVSRDRIYRTPDSAFANVAELDYDVRYDEYGSLRYAFIDVVSDRAVDLLAGSLLSAEETAQLTAQLEAPSIALRTVHCLHGQPTWSYLYRKMIPGFLSATAKRSQAHLAHTGYRYVKTRVLLPDLLGFGRSDKPLDDAFYTFDMHRHFLIHFITKHMLNQSSSSPLIQATLVVHDWGGILGLSLPMVFPSLFTHLIVMNTLLVLGHAPSQAWLDFKDSVARSPNLDVGGLIRRGTPISDAEENAYNAPFVQGGHNAKAGVRSFASIVPVHPSMAGVAESKAAQAYFNALANQSFTENSLQKTTSINHATTSSLNVFVAVGGADPVLGKPVMDRLCKSTFQSTGYLYHLIPEAGHFVPEWAAHVPHLAESAWSTLHFAEKENGASWHEAGLGELIWSSPLKAAARKAQAKPILTFVTGNANKLREVKQILASSPHFPYTLANRDLDLPEIQGTTQQVARAKCSAASEALDGPCITEDTALSFHALNGLPGPYIKDFLKSIGHAGLNSMLDGFADRTATAICTFAYCAGPGQQVHLFEGMTDGLIVPPRGPTHFGWDPILEIPPTGLTYAEMDATQKNSLSHRYKALRLLHDFLASDSSAATCTNNKL